MHDDGFASVWTRRQLLRAAAAGALGGVIGAAAPRSASAAISSGLPSRSTIVAKYGGLVPWYWGLHAPGSWSTFPTNTTVAADAVCLTFDACRGSSGYDATLIDVLRRHGVPATLFVNRGWAVNYPRTFQSLATDPLFEIGNHGTLHKPLSVTGRSAYGITGTRSAGEVYDEIAGMHEWMATYYDRRPRCFRPGTAHADDVATRITRAMGEWVVSFSVNGDFGATATSDQVYQQFLKVRPGGIVLAHFNHPGSGTASGVARALPVLKGRGYKFRRLSQVIPSTTTSVTPPSW